MFCQYIINVYIAYKLSAFSAAALINRAASIKSSKATWQNWRRLVHWRPGTAHVRATLSKKKYISKPKIIYVAKMTWTYLKIVWRPHGPVTLIHIHPTLHLLNPVEMYPNMVISTGKETEMMKKTWDSEFGGFHHIFKQTRNFDFLDTCRTCICLLIWWF